MKLLLLFLFSIQTALAVDPLQLLKIHDSKVYHLKKKVVKDIVVEVESPQLKKQLESQQIFGSIDRVAFKFYWTLEPLRLNIDIIGLPEGFKEIKENLKQTMFSKFEYMYPMTIEEKFKGYTFKNHPTKVNSILATDSSGLQAIPEFELVFDSEQKIISIIGKKPIGEQIINLVYEKTSWSNGQNVLKKQISTTQEGPQITVTESNFEYMVTNGIGAISSVNTKVSQKSVANQSKSQDILFEESFYFLNTKLNASEAQKWFLSIGGN
jgi:hypothetical protein